METLDSIPTTQPMTVPVTPEPAAEHTHQPQSGLETAPETSITEENTSEVVRTEKQSKTERPLNTVKTVKARYFVPKYLSYPPAGHDLPVNPRTHQVIVTADTTAVKVVTDSVTNREATDSVARDTLPPGEIKEGIVLVDPAAKYLKQEQPLHKHFAWGGGMSWIYLVLALLFCAIGVKFKGNARYMKALYADLVDTRVRNNMFDETVRESSLLVLLNLLWVACAGVLLWTTVTLTAPLLTQYNLTIPAKPAGGIGLCIAIAALYQVFMQLAYWIVGRIFSERRETRLWVKGAAAANGLETFILFPCALVTLAYPAWDFPMLIVAAGVFVFGKIIFLYKGFRIFFNEISSWLLFLYYLCSLEIVPLILTYAAAIAVCSSWL